jgi:hypothetical protein
MPAMTLLESAKLSTDVIRKGVIRVISERTPILPLLPFKTIKGNAYTYNMESALPGIAFRAVGDTWPRSTHVINPATERLVIMGGEVFIDNFQIRTQGNLGDVKAAAYTAKSKALGLIFSEKFFEADSASNMLEFDGVRTRITGNQVVTAGANGAALTLDMLDQFIDTIAGNGTDAHMFLNTTLRRKVTKLGRDATNAPLIDTGTNNFGKQVIKYGGVPMHIIERDDDASTFLDFDETQGASSVTASIYMIRFGEDYVLGLQGAGGEMEVKDFGETEAAPGHLGRIEWYPGMAVHHPRAMARLKGITNA